MIEYEYELFKSLSFLNLNIAPIVCFTLCKIPKFHLQIFWCRNFVELRNFLRVLDNLSRNSAETVRFQKTFTLGNLVTLREIR